MSDKPGWEADAEAIALPLPYTYPLSETQFSVLTPLRCVCCASYHPEYHTHCFASFSVSTSLSIICIILAYFTIRRTVRRDKTRFCFKCLFVNL
jgi:hypothetical protein